MGEYKGVLAKQCDIAGVTYPAGAEVTVTEKQHRYLRVNGALADNAPKVDDKPKDAGALGALAVKK